MIVETGVVAFTTFFATIGPIDVAAMYAAMTTGVNQQQKKAMAKRGTLVASIILVGFALLGEVLLDSLGISLAALRTAGGILLLLISIDMAFARSSGATSTTENEAYEATIKKDIAVFPLATPLIAGPGAMGAVILLMGNTEGNIALQCAVMAALFSVLIITFIGLLLASKIQGLLGVTGMGVITRVFGVLLCALAVQFIFDGLALSGLFKL
jgi:multiple antibiotic resistance protein